MKIYSLAAGGKKEDEVPILPRCVSDSIIDLQEEKKGVEADIEAVDRAKLVSGKRRPIPQPAKIVMKKKAKKTFASEAVCDVVIGCILFMIGLTIIGLSICKVYSQMEYQNKLVTKVNQNHHYTKDELYAVEYFINDLHKDLQTLMDSVKHIEEEGLHSDDDIELDGDDDSHDVVLDYPRYPDTSSPIIPMYEGEKNSDDLQYDDEEDEEDPINYMMSSSTAGSSTPLETTSQAAQREEYPADYSEYDTEGKIYNIHY